MVQVETNDRNSIADLLSDPMDSQRPGPSPAPHSKLLKTSSNEGKQLISYHITPKPPPEPLPFPLGLLVTICCGGNMKYLVFPTLMAVSLGLFLAFSRAVSSTTALMGYSQYQNSRELSEDEPSLPKSHLFFGSMLKDHAAMFHARPQMFQQQLLMQQQQQQQQQQPIPGGDASESCDCSRCEVDNSFLGDNTKQYQRLVKHSFQHFYGKPELAVQMEAFVPGKQKMWAMNPVFYISPDQICADDGSPLAVIVVHSHHRHMIERNVVRDTWGGVAKGRPWPRRQMVAEVRLIFVLEVSEDPIDNDLATKESDKYGDIVLVDVQETSQPASRKVLSGFKWVLQHCTGTQYIIKVEEDTFLDVPLLLSVLANQDLTNMIFGPILFAETVQRLTADDKVLVSKQAYFPEWYPPYAKGTVYALPTSLAKRLLTVAEYLPYVSTEDAFITGILAKVFDARHINIPEHLYDTRVNNKPELCDFVYRKKMVAHKVNSALARGLWRRMEKAEMCGLYPAEE
ncbi:unnamed protein product [Lymnaea stagnalis]|uniref:Hexosyltransferase n=1 Tax=Lymnaea stagnalis TaxID=6523 RepID=A0AAV2HPX2_LYMST